MQTTNHNEQPENRTDGGGAENEKDELKSKTAPLEKFLEEKDRHIQKLNATIQQMKERQRSEIQFIKREEEIEKSALLRKIRDTRDEIISLKESRPPMTERDIEDHQQNKTSDHTGRREIGESSNGQQSTKQRHRPKERDFGRNRKLPPRL